MQGRKVEVEEGRREEKVEEGEDATGRKVEVGDEEDEEEEEGEVWMQ